MTESGNKKLGIQKLNSWEITPSGLNIEQLLGQLGGPTRIRITGNDSSRCRVLVTLLHGNEPSGLMAIALLLQDGFRPAVDIYCYVIAIEAASLLPVFSHRQVPGKRDYNRCFKQPYDIDDQGQICWALLKDIEKLSPEAVVDMHNTSGEGPSFGVTTTYDKKHDDIVSLFTNRLIVTDLSLGAIMESNTSRIPVVTIECGGAFEEAAHRTAVLGLQRYFAAERLFAEQGKDYGIELFFNPLRVEMHNAVGLGYGSSMLPGTDITLKTDIEHHNFGQVTADTLLGWVGESVMLKLAAFDAGRANLFTELYREEGGCLFPRSAQKLFMITSNPDIAVSDCLWYTVADKSNR